MYILITVRHIGQLWLMELVLCGHVLFKEAHFSAEALSTKSKLECV